ncbi:hypothetical protein S40293_02276 [Stachybotrys chartarum IBT 40293]|nr:hypothetical protein S40293_02276 [Stachybotrys chartarum IBT 40293]
MDVTSILNAPNGDWTELSLDDDLWNSLAHMPDDFPGLGDLSTQPWLNDDVSIADSAFTGDAFPATAYQSCFFNVQAGLESWARGTTQLSGAPDQDGSRNLTMQDSSPSGGAHDASDGNENHEESQTVCYGMIHCVAVRLLGDGSSLNVELQQRAISAGKAYITFTLCSKNGCILVEVTSEITLGVLNDNSSTAIRSLLSRSELRFEPVARPGDLREKISTAHKANHAIVHLDINVYGPAGLATEIGGELTKSKVWLQRPDYQQRQYPYENPHTIHFPDISNDMQQEEISAGVDQTRPERGDSIAQLVQDVQASTQRAHRLERATGDARLKTSLLPHQGKALTFMRERESGNIQENFRLWKPATVDGQNLFVHSITKTRCHDRPNEGGGGILADEMGMGKSLSTLALIIGTLQEGHEWAQKSRDEELGSSRIKAHSHGTLVIVPSALLITNWVKEIKLHLGDAISFVKYHGQTRERCLETLSKADVVLTTYKTLATDDSLKSNHPRRQPLRKIEWFRIVLDEAHNIRRPATTFYKACCELQGRSRWCLTGTPIQNTLEDLGALLAFLKAKPFHSLAQFRRYLVIPYQQHDPIAKDRLVMLYDSLILQQSKRVLHLPGQEERLREVHLTDEEKQQYKQAEDMMQRSIRQRAGERGENGTIGLFEAHLHLRLICNHGTHQKPRSWQRHRRSKEEREAWVVELGLNAEQKCDMCSQPRPIIATSNAISQFVEDCKHFLCADCLDAQSEEADLIRRRCPICSDLSNGTTDLLFHQDTQDTFMSEADSRTETERSFENGYFNTAGHSSKIHMLIEDVKQALAETGTDENGRRTKSKSIIFSCWTKTLDLIHRYLQRNDMESLRIDGDCSLSQRQKVLDRFSSNGGPQVLLMTTGTGAFGLNLTAANHIFIVELQWNPSVESQAIARAVRIRQQDKVIVTRYIVVGTVEENLKSQQINKKRAAQAGLKEQDGT